MHDLIEEVPRESAEDLKDKFAETEEGFADISSSSSSLSSYSSDDDSNDSEPESEASDCSTCREMYAEADRITYTTLAQQGSPRAYEALNTNAHEEEEQLHHLEEVSEPDSEEVSEPETDASDCSTCREMYEEADRITYALLVQQGSIRGYEAPNPNAHEEEEQHHHLEEVSESDTEVVHDGECSTCREMYEEADRMEDAFLAQQGSTRAYEAPNANDRDRQQQEEEENYTQSQYYESSEIEEDDDDDIFNASTDTN